MDLKSKAKNVAVNVLAEGNILGNIFKYLDVKSISRCRLVCTKWEDIATPLFETKIDSITIEFDGEKKSKFVKFLSMIRGSSLIFTKFSFRNILIRNNSTIAAFFQACGESMTSLKLHYSDSNVEITYSDLLRDILMEKAPNLTALELDIQPLGETYTPVFPNDPNIRLKVKNLTLHITTEDFHEFQGYDQPLLKDLIKVSPDLEELTLKSNCLDVALAGRAESWLVTGYLEYMVINQRLQKLTALDLGFLDSSDLKILTNNIKTAQLKKFKGSFYTSIDWRDFARFLESQNNSLENLSFNIGHPSYQEEERKFTLPKLPKLKFLDIFFERLLVGCQVKTNISPIDYGFLFPQLEKLAIHGPGEEIERSRYCYLYSRSSFTFRVNKLFPSDSNPCPNVRDLTLPKYLKSGKTLERIAQIFPNVVKLNLGRQARGGASIFEALWSAWPKLEELSIYMMTPKEGQVGIYSNDSLFTGFPEDVCSKVAAEMGIQKFEGGNSATATAAANMDIAELAKLKTKPSIANLTKLRKLVIQGFFPTFDEYEYDSDPYGDSYGEDSENTDEDEVSVKPGSVSNLLPPSVLTNVTGYFGFLELKELVELALMEKHKISKICVNKICDELGLTVTSVRGDFMWLEKFPGEEEGFDIF